MIVGQTAACARLEELLAAVRRGDGGSIALTGPAGIGKTTLLQFAADRAADLRVLRATGSPAEEGIPYAGLAQILTPILDWSKALPPMQATAIEAALAIGPSAGPDAFPVYAGTLGLLAAAASDTPVVVLVDDAQWLDAASLQALMFAQRRLVHDHVVVILAARPQPDTPPTWADLPSVEIAGLDVEGARALMLDRGLTVNDEVLGWLVRATGGNPLAILDLPTYLPSAELDVRAHRSQPAPVGPVLTAAYGQAMSTMTAAERQALLIAAMLDDTDLSVLHRALQAAELSLEELESAEDAGLLGLEGPAVTMRHPLVRSAVIQLATPSARRAAHAACAEALQHSSRRTDTDARVWHLADAAVGADDNIAAMLEEQAQVAAARTGYAAACLINQRAAELSEPGDGRTRRLLAAAEAGLAAGLPTESLKLLSRLDGETLTSVVQTAQVAHLRARLQSAAGDPPGAALELERQAEAIRDVSPDLAVRISLDAAFSAVLAGDMDRAVAAGNLIAAVPGGPVTEALADLILGTAHALRGGGQDARPQLDSSRRVFDVPHPNTQQLEALVYLATAYTLTNSFTDSAPMLERAIAIARTRGAIGILPFALAMSATTAYRTGDWDSGYAQASEAAALAVDSGQAHVWPNALVMVAQIDAARGLERAREHIVSVIRESSAMGTRFLEAQGHSMLGLLELSLGRPADAVPALQTCGRLSRQFGLVELGHLQWAAELIEAEMRCGRNAYSADTLQVMRRAAHPGATSLNRALLARCEGILTTDSSWEDSFRRAIELHGGPNLRPFELARTQLCFGERLRRHRRRRDARHQLSQAWETFADLGADAWAQRASQEIAALGGGAPGPVRHVTDLLTPQEFQVAATVAGGATNREAASALFLSQKTIEFHLSNIYRRLGVRSRAELAAALEGRNRAQENSQRPGPAPAG